MEIFTVGGAVRDSLLGLDPKDKDFVVVGSSVEEMLSKGFTQVGKDFPVFLHPETGDEWALARKERSVGASHTDFECDVDGVTLEEDLLRRDLTINSMAMDENGQVIDPFNGMRDIRCKFLRHTSEAFKEDPLRVLRVARFHARMGSEWKVAARTEIMLEVMFKDGLLDHLVPERVWAETEKALMEKSPWIFFEDLFLWAEQELPEKVECDLWAGFQMAMRRAVAKGFTLEQRWALANLFFMDHSWFQKLFNQEKFPKGCSKLAKQFRTIHLEDIGIVNAQDTLIILEQLDFFRKPDILRTMLQLSSVIHFDGILESGTMIAEIGMRTREVKAQPFVDMGLTGQEIGDKIRLERLRIIQEILENE